VRRIQVEHDSSADVREADDDRQAGHDDGGGVQGAQGARRIGGRDLAHVRRLLGIVDVCLDALAGGHVGAQHVTVGERELTIQKAVLGDECFLVAPVKKTV